MHPICYIQTIIQKRALVFMVMKMNVFFLNARVVSSEPVISGPILFLPFHITQKQYATEKFTCHNSSQDWPGYVRPEDMATRAHRGTGSFTETRD